MFLNKYVLNKIYNSCKVFDCMCVHFKKHQIHNSYKALIVCEHLVLFYLQLKLTTSRGPWFVLYITYFNETHNCSDCH